MVRDQKLKKLTSCPCKLLKSSYHSHVNAICITPGMLKVLFQSLSQWVWYLMESNKLAYSIHLSMIPCGPAVQSLDDR